MSVCARALAGVRDGYLYGISPEWNWMNVFSPGSGAGPTGLCCTFEPGCQAKAVLTFLYWYVSVLGEGWVKTDFLSGTYWGARSEKNWGHQVLEMSLSLLPGGSTTRREANAVVLSLPDAATL